LIAAPVTLGILTTMGNEPDHRRLTWERATDWPLTGLAVCYLAAYAAPIVYPQLAAAGKRISEGTMWLAWGAFAVDYLVRLAITDQRRLFVRKHLLDALVIALPLLRPLRLLRLLSVLRVLNRQATVSFLGRIATYVGGSAVLLILVASLAELDAERQNPQANITTVPDALWWAISTITTVGYGDRYPTTQEGRLVAVGLMLAGIALLGVVTATVAAWFVQRVQRIEAAEARTREDMAPILDELRAMRLDIASLRNNQTDHEVPPRSTRNVASAVRSAAVEVNGADA
jgi:voltage-gated potassium channel